VSCAVVHATVNVMSTGLGDASGRYILVTLVDSVLHLLKELVDVEQIVLGSDIGHGRKVVSRRLRATRAVATAAADRDRCRNLLIFRNRAIEDGQLESLQAEKALADRGVGVRIELATLEVAEELVQCIVATLAIVSMVSVLPLAQGIVHIAVGMRVCGLRGRVRLIVLRGGVCILRVDTVDGALKVMSGSGISLGVLREHHVRVLHARLGRPNLGVVGMGLDMLLQILGALERLAAEVTLVRLERHMYPDVRSDVVPLDGCGVTSTPLAGEVEVVSTLASNVAFANVLIESLGGRRLFSTPNPLARQLLADTVHGGAVDRCSGSGSGRSD
jgi:hypothetical protein